MVIKDAESLERMEKVDTLVVDKTGTHTEGNPSVTEVDGVAGDRNFMIDSEPDDFVAQHD